MRVVLDSNAVIKQDWLLQGPYAEVLIQAAARDDVELVVPDVVFREIVGAHSREVDAAIEELRKILRRVSSLGAVDAGSELSADPSPHGYASALFARLVDVKVRRAPIPEVAHTDIVERAIARRPPFDKGRKDGYRDTLIWHNVLEEAMSGDSVVLVTSDTDFADIDARMLRPELARELVDLGLDPDRVRVAVSLKEAAHDVVEPATKVVEELGNRLKCDPEWARFIHDTLTEVAVAEAGVVDDSAVDVAMEVGAEPLVDGIEEQQLDYVDDLRDISLESALPIGEDRFLIELRARSLAFYELDVSTSTSWERPDAIPPPGITYSPDERTARLGGSAEVVLVFDAAYDARSKTITRPQLERLGPDVDERSAHVRELRRRQMRKALAELRARRE